MWKVGAFVLYILINGLMACIHRDIRRYRIIHGITKQINHPLWAFIYCIIVGASWFLFHDWFFIVAVLLQHLWFFSPFYNAITEWPLFYLSKTTTAVTDRLMVKMGFTSTEKVMALAAFISAILLTKSIANG